MRLKTAFILLLAASLPGLAAPVDWQKLVTGNNAFAFQLLRQISQDQPTSNIFISPYSATLALQMAVSGANGPTKTEMQQILQMTNQSAATVGEDIRELTQMFGAVNKNVILTIANSMWCQKNAAISKDFIANARRYFRASVASLDFSDPHSADVINQWASRQTHAKINHLADGMLDPATQLFLADAIYFKGKWSDPFKVADTTDQPFHLRGGEQIHVPMMTKTRSFTYRRGTGYQAVRLPYVGDNLAMYVFLPDANSSPEKLLSVMSGETWQRVTKPGFASQDGTLVLPRFKLEYGVELKNPLMALGMKIAFDPHAADFSGIAPQLYISAVRQMTFVEVKEEGTEAAAVTGTKITALSAEPVPPDPFTMIVDRPFLFLIEDNQTGTILFMGVIFDPAEN